MTDTPAPHLDLDLAAVTVAELLDWMLDPRTGTCADPRLLRAALLTGLTDLTVLADHQTALRGPAGAELTRLADRLNGQPLDPPLTIDDLAGLALVGHQTYLTDRDNVAEWRTAARLIAEHATGHPREAWARSQHTARSELDPRAICAEALDAGLSPHTLHRIVERAAVAGVVPDAYGFGPDITPASFTALAAAGVTGRNDLAAYLAAGVPFAEVPALAAAKVPPGAAIAARRLGVTPAVWADRLGGMDPSWFPVHDMTGHRQDPQETGALGRAGFTLDQLHDLVAGGWGSIPLHHLLQAHYGRGRRSGGSLTWTPSDAVQMARHQLTPADLERWAQALTASGNQQDSRPNLLGTSRRGGFRLAEHLPAIYRLRDAGVRPSHLDDYRHGGCQDVDDVLHVVAAGVTGPRMAHLRATYGHQPHSWMTKTFPDTATLLRAHHDHPA